MLPEELFFFFNLKELKENFGTLWNSMLSLSNKKPQNCVLDEANSYFW
jgi:hypothetical protein